MSERERWIVYPLVFFALGAALRDKFTQSVHTEELRAGKIACEELVVLDSDSPNRSVAKLLSAPSPSSSASSARYGVLALYDSEGKEICGVTNNQLTVNSIAITNPKNQAQPLALLTSASQSDNPNTRFGSLLLQDSEGHILWMTPNKPPSTSGAPRPAKNDSKQLPPERKKARRESNPATS
jgi:hypothetical protein